MDGLRAVAVLLVVSFHAGFGLPFRWTPWIGKHISASLAYGLAYGPQGGFVGVDIFFVISGFLIGGILLRELKAGTFSIVRFYERRVRRIVPALVAVLVFTWLVGYFALLPSDMLDLCKSMLAAILSAANLYFWKTSGYFDVPSLQKPLLHTWSLAVEEQFYLAFPLFLCLVHRYARRYMRTAVQLMAATSLVVSIWQVHKDPVAAFYLPQTRAWEMLLGAIVVLYPFQAPSWVRNLLSLSGLGLILYSAFHLSSNSLFPGIAALPPCIGAALILAAHRSGTSAIGAILSWRPVVFIGLISYSLYLWHWPLLLINKYDLIEGISFSKPSLLAAMLIIAALSWRFVEQPFRAGRLKLPRRVLFATAATALCFVAGLDLWAVRAAGISSRFSPAELKLAQETGRESQEGQWGTSCFASANLATISPSCLFVSQNKPNYLLFGDSHAAHLWYGLSTTFPQVNWLEATASGCRPLLFIIPSPDQFCRNLDDTIFNEFLPAAPGSTVILSAKWTDRDLESLSKTVAHLHAADIRVYVIGPIEVYDQPLPHLLIQASRSGNSRVVEKHLLLSRDEFQSTDDRLAAAVLAAGGDRYISMRKLLCNSDSCLHYATAGTPLQFDEGHLTNAGSLLVAQKFKAAGLLP